MFTCTNQKYTTNEKNIVNEIVKVIHSYWTVCGKQNTIFFRVLHISRLQQNAVWICFGIYSERFFCSNHTLMETQNFTTFVAGAFLSNESFDVKFGFCQKTFSHVITLDKQLFYFDWNFWITIFENTCKVT